MKTLSLLLVIVVSFSAAAVADDKPIAAIAAVKVTPKRNVFSDASRQKPIEVRSADQAAKYFDSASLAKLKKQVDFKKQFVLIFAWRGSGQDKLSFDVLESDPEQIVFRYKPGRTRDLRPHVYVYALRSNVTWSAGKR